MEGYKKIILFDKEGNEYDSMEGVVSYEAHMDKVEFTSVFDGDGGYEGFEGYYIVTDEGMSGDDITTEMVIDFFRSIKAQEMSEECNKAIEAGFDYNGDSFDYDQIAQNNLTSTMMSLFLDSSITEVYVKGRIAGDMMLTKDEFLALYRASEEHKKTLRAKYTVIKDNLLNGDFESLEKLKNVTWDNS
ncbi:hypothetical protein ABEU97_20375 [Priestia megaterium]